MASYIDMNAAVKEAKEAISAREAALKRVAIVRADLRHAAEAGGGTPEQRQWVAETFPPRERKGKTAKGGA